MGLRTISKLDRVIEEEPWPVQSQDPYLVAALAATLVAYRRSVRPGNGQSPSEDARSNWRIMGRMAQLQRRP
jgi:hypothetical protein